MTGVAWTVRTAAGRPLRYAVPGQSTACWLDSCLSGSRLVTRSHEPACTFQRVSLLRRSPMPADNPCPKALQEYRISLPLAPIVRRSRRRNLIQPASSRRRNQRNLVTGNAVVPLARWRMRATPTTHRQATVWHSQNFATSTSSHHAVYELLVLFRQLKELNPIPD